MSCMILDLDPGLWASVVADMVKNLPVMWEMWVRSLGQEDPLEKRMANHSSILAWKIPWTEEPGGSMGSTGSQKSRTRKKKESDTTERLSTHTRAGRCICFQRITRHHHLSGLNNSFILPVCLEAGSAKSQGQQGWFLLWLWGTVCPALSPSFWRLQASVGGFLRVFTSSSLSACLPLCPSFPCSKNSGPIGLEPTLLTST